MAPLNPFYRQEVASEQRLVQDLVNEHLRMYGQEVYYLPRKYIGTDSIMKENVLAKFDDAYPIEAYVMNVDGFQGSGDLMTKFGIRVTDEATFIISRERFEDYIFNLISTIDDTQDSRRALGLDLGMRPYEGDLIYFGLTDSLFEIKFVEHENPFYQLGQLTTYELRCELFEYEDEVIDTDIADIDDNAADIGYVVTLTLAGLGVTAGAQAGLSTGSVSRVVIENDGYGYSTVPIVAISSSPNTAPFADARAVAIGTVGTGLTTYSVQEIKLINPGFGYTQPPTVTLVGDGGGAQLRADIAAIGAVRIDQVAPFVGGLGYRPGANINVSISTSPVGLATANATADGVVSAAGTVAQIRFSSAGFGYTVVPSFNIDSPYQTRNAIANIGFTTVGMGTITNITIADAGLGNTTPPAITISSPSGFRQGIVTSGVGIGSTVNSLSIGNTGAYYGSAPVVTIADPPTIGVGSGVTATATAYVNVTTGILTGLTITNPGLGYTAAPDVSLSSGIATATATALVNAITGIVTDINITYVGAGYTTQPTVSFSEPPVGVNTGVFMLNEVVTGTTGLATALVKDYDDVNKTLKVYRVAGTFVNDEKIVGSATTLDGVDRAGSYYINQVSYEDTDDKWEANTEIQDAATDIDGIVDWTETNPFGTF
tara:strand:+ start:453 stop:2423 length:1971 start_codon:yes stop_codon:yes gene_type:complete